MRIVADDWEQNLNADMNKHIPPEELHDDRRLQLQRMWNRRVQPAVPAERSQVAIKGELAAQGDPVLAPAQFLAPDGSISASSTSLPAQMFPPRLVTRD